MPEALRQFNDLSRESKAHFIYPIMDSAFSSGLQRNFPSRRARHLLTAVLLNKEILKPSEATRTYWNEHGISQSIQVDEVADYLITSGWQDFYRIATSGHVRLRTEGVRRNERRIALRNSHELLKVARIALSDLSTRTEPGLPVLGIKYRHRPDAVYFGLRRAIPLRGTVFDSEAGVVRLSESYEMWITEYRKAAHDAGVVVGCPAPHVLTIRVDGSRTNLLVKAWESYIDGVYAGKPNDESDQN